MTSDGVEAMQALARSLDWSVWEPCAEPGAMKPVEIFQCVWAADGDICNGGFSQFFGNSTGNRTRDIVHSYRSIGASRAADLIEAAEKIIFGGAAPAAQETRGPVVEAINGAKETALVDLDDEFCAPALSSEVDRRLLQFLNRNNVLTSGPAG